MGKRYLIIDIQGLELTKEDKEILSLPEIAGVTLFSRNFKDLEQFKNLTASIKKIKKHELLITIDQEGGIVQRIKEPLTILPPAYDLGQQYMKDPSQALQDAFKVGYTMASELMSLGVDLSFAPVLDTFDPRSQVISTRAFHFDPQVITKLAHRYVAGMNAAGMTAVGKHFPGHGAVMEDSHLQLPVSNYTLPELEMKHLIPFINLSSNLGAFMTSHIVFPNVDMNPVTFSKRWLQDILRDKYHFKGYIFSDCLNMQGAVEKFQCPKERVIRALNAGVDFVLLLNDRSSVLKALGLQK